MIRLYPDPGGEVDLAAAYAYPPGPATWLRANMVQSADGAAWRKGLSHALSGPADRTVFMLLRVLSDAILVGANTVRTEGYGPARVRPEWSQLRAGRPAVPAIAVVTRRLDLDLSGRLFTEAPPDARTIVITTEAAPADRRARAAERAEVVVAGTTRVDVKAAVEALAERGHRRLLCEGGPRLLAGITAAGLLDELCVTVSPLLVAGDAARILNGAPLAEPARLRPAHILEDEGFLLCRYLAREPGGGS